MFYSSVAVSYTHLDVYKRQLLGSEMSVSEKEMGSETGLGPTLGYLSTGKRDVGKRERDGFGNCLLYTSRCV